MYQFDTLSNLVIREALAVHREYGPGLFESAYEEMLTIALEEIGLDVQRQVVLPFVFRGQRIERGYRVDMIVNFRLYLEIKSIDTLAPVHTRQLLTYLRLGGGRVGLLLNFGAPVLRDGIKRVVNDYRPGDTDTGEAARRG